MTVAQLIALLQGFNQPSAAVYLVGQVDGVTTTQWSPNSVDISISLTGAKASVYIK